MSQQINLFDPSLRPRRALLTASRLAFMAGALAAAMVGYSMWVDTLARQEEAVLAKTDARLKDLQAQATRLGLTASRVKNQALEESIAKAESELRMRQSLLERLKGGKLGNTRGFSDYMVALARQRIEGIWITGLTVAEGGQDFRIQGGVTRPELLTEYIRGLSREEVMKGKPIDDLRMERKGGAIAAAGAGASATKPRFVEFSIASGSSRGGPGG